MVGLSILFVTLANFFVLQNTFGQDCLNSICPYPTPKSFFQPPEQDNPPLLPQISQPPQLLTPSQSLQPSSETPYLPQPTETSLPPLQPSQDPSPQTSTPTPGTVLKQSTFTYPKNTFTTEHQTTPNVYKTYSRQTSYLVILPSDLVREGQQIVFTCSTDVENAKLEWRFNQKNIMQPKRVTIVDYGSSSELEINPVLSSDSGNISCHELRLNDSVSLVVSVISRPIVTVKPGFYQVVGETSYETFSATISPFLNLNNVIFNWYIGDSLDFEENSMSISLWINRSLTLRCGVLVPGFSETLSNRVYVEYLPSIGDCGDDEMEGYRWGPNYIGTTQLAPCPDGYNGFMERKCLEGRKWDSVNRSSCMRIIFTDIEKELEKARDDLTGLNPGIMLDVSKKLKDFWGNKDITQKDDAHMIDLIYKTAVVRGEFDEGNETYYEGGDVFDEQNFEKEMDNMMTCVGWVLERFSKGKFNCNKECSVRMLESMNVYVNTKVYQPNFLLQYNNAITFERQMLQQNMKQASFPDWNKFKMKRKSCISLLPAFFQKRQNNQNYYIGSFYVDELTNYLPTENNGSYINSGFISLDIRMDREVLSSLDGEHFVECTIEHRKPLKGNDSASCVFWKFADSGHWSSDGCMVVSSNVTHTTCICNHLTNFAILVSPFQDISQLDLRILTLISLIGCVISLLALLFTIAYYLVMWRKVKSKRAVLVLDLCVALMVANVVLLIEYGIPDSIQASCTALAVLLHFFFLAAFFSMLAISIHLFLSIFFVFFVFTKKIITLMVVLTWIFPLIIVAVSMGVRRLEGYGSDNNCWLSLKDGLLWAFVGPALFIIAFNTVVVIAVLVKLCTMNSQKAGKGKRNNLKSSVRNLFILNPVLGLTWIFGVLSANENLIVFQYLFTIINSLQGLFIFILYAICHKSNKPAMAKSMKAVEKMTKRQSAQTNFKNISYNNYDGTTSTSDNISNSTSELTEQEYIKLENAHYRPSVKNT